LDLVRVILLTLGKDKIYLRQLQVEFLVELILKIIGQEWHQCQKHPKRMPLLFNFA
jgi:hypothetical protein